MRIVFTSAILFVLVLIYAFRIPEISSSPEQEMVEKSILEWADKTFEYYDGPRFEKFLVIPSNDFFKLENQVSSLKEYREELKQNFAAGEIKKTKEEFEASLKKLDRKIDSLSTAMNSSVNKANGYEIDFWANIMVNNALTVYYVHHIKLDSKYVITEAKITGSIGKENDQIKILYKKNQGK
ncbi:MAG: hypothetical protein K1X56_01185 [Flavobacteriales bacterium]|nr:hypothetical protein [Flavobacteriales bacterium]